jgi:predicted ATPase
MSMMFDEELRAVMHTLSDDDISILRTYMTSVATMAQETTPSSKYEYLLGIMRTELQETKTMEARLVQLLTDQQAQIDQLSARCREMQHELHAKDEKIVELESRCGQEQAVQRGLTTIHQLVDSCVAEVRQTAAQQEEIARLEMLVQSLTRLIEDSHASTS